jgi:23S rRNA (pseudouridine1915-N3)-methyltransferase
VKIQLLAVGKTQKQYVSNGIKDYTERLKHYIPFEMHVIQPTKKNAKHVSGQLLSKLEDEALMKKINSDDFIILLDERGKSFRSIEFAQFLQKKFLETHKRMIFVIGGAWGFGENIKKRANTMISLSEMTFSHQLIRLFFLEQLYRAFTIMKNEPYHNE